MDMSASMPGNYEPNEAIEGYSGVQKAAELLITLGPEKSSVLMKHLKEDEIEELTLEIANTRSISPEVKEAVISGLPGAAVYRRGWYWICQTAFGECVGVRAGAECDYKTHSILTGSSI